MRSHLKIKPKRNKAYRPKPVSRAGGLAVIDKQHYLAEMCAPIPADHATDLFLAYWIAFDQMLRGQSSEETWCTVVCSLNIALVLAELGIGKAYEPHIIKVLDGAFRAKLRGDRTGIWRFDGEAITDIRQALEVHDEQVQAVTKQQMQDALYEVYRRVDSGHVYRTAA